MELRLFTIFLGLFTIAKCRLTEIVYTTKGPVQGNVLNTVVNSVEYYSFKGIPYAEPPLGYLRFKPPIEKTAWTEVLQTTVEGANCVQKDFLYHNYTGSEDCLYLNVYTPQIDYGNGIAVVSKPVMVWIYGGSFKSGYGNSSLYGPDLLIEEDVVLVTFNYRLGPLGFLSLNHENATGNAGLKDQNLVLRWVNENIAKFGGNPKKITLFGQSAGGVAVDLHSLSDLSKDLFHQSISMSASPLCPWGFSTANRSEKQAFALGSLLNVNTNNKEELLKVLYQTPAVTLMKKTQELGSPHPPFTPTIEKTEIAKDQMKFLTQCSYENYMNGNFLDIPHITGYTKDETLLYTKSLNSIIKLLNSTANYIHSIPSLSYVSIPFIDTIVSALSESATSLTESMIKQIVQETSDLLFVQGIDSKQKLMDSKSNSPIYYYHLTHEANQSIHKLLYDVHLNGVAHGDDLGYLFHMKVANLSLDPNDIDFITRRRMVRLWTNFAKYGNPTPNDTYDDLLGGVTWPVSGSTGAHLEIGEDLVVGKRPTNMRVQMYQMANSIVLPHQTGCTFNPVSTLSTFINGPVSRLFYKFGQILHMTT